MEINKVLSLASHCLHLCNNSNIKEIVSSYLMDADAFVTNNAESWEKMLNENEIKCPIKKPNEVKRNMKIVVDGGSLGDDFRELESRWKGEKATCIYNVDRIDPSILKDLVDFHDKMLLSTEKMRVISDKNIEKEIEELSPEITENLIKRDLRNIVLSLLLSKPMSGTDLVKLLYSKFKVFVSPGMLYPTLHELEKKGLLKYECKLKNKIYSVQVKDQAKLLLQEHGKANLLLSQFFDK